MKKRVKLFCLCLVTFMSMCGLLCGCGSKEAGETELDQSNSSKDDAPAQEFDRIELTYKNILDYIDYSFTYELSIDTNLNTTSGSTKKRVFNVKLTTWSPFSDYEFYNVAVTFYDSENNKSRVVRINKTGQGLYNFMESYYYSSTAEPKVGVVSTVAEGSYVLIPRSP